MRSRVAHDLLAEPRNVLLALELNPDDFEFQREVSPEGLNVNGHGVMTFPILVVKDRHHKELVEMFLEHEEALAYKDSGEVPF